jgi:hypothetical protein
MKNFLATLIATLFLLASCTSGNSTSTVTALDGNCTDVVGPNLPQQSICFSQDHGRALVGDIDLGDVTKIQQQNQNRHQLGLVSSLSNTFDLWPNRVIPFVINPGFTESNVADIYAAMAHFTQALSFHFVPRTTESNYVNFMPITSATVGGESQIGMVGGGQPLSLNLTGSNKFTVIHELGHLVGLLHEHQRADRDQYINVYFANMLPTFYPAFNKIRTATALSYYDFDSAMHYSAFSGANVNQFLPMLSRKDGTTTGLIYDKYLSAGDVQSINTLYAVYPPVVYPAPATLNAGSNFHVGNWKDCTNYGVAASGWANHLDFFTVNCDGTGGLIHYMDYANVQTKELLAAGYTFTSSPASVSWGNGRTDVVVRGSDNALWTIYFDPNAGGWSPMIRLDGSIPLSGAPTISSWALGRLDIFMTDPNGHLEHKYFSPTGWSAWENLGGKLTSEPSAISWGFGRIDVFAKGADNGLWTVFFGANGWSTWVDLGGTIEGPPSVASHGPNELDVFASCGAMALCHMQWQNTWLGWDGYFQGVTTQRTAAVWWGESSFTIFGQGSDYKLWGFY